MSDDPFDFYGGLEDEVDDVEPAGRAPDGAASAAIGAQNEEVEEVPPLYADFYQFMNEFIGPQISRKLSEQTGAGLRWDPDWWRYPEAVLRANLMWHSFEAARIKDMKDPGELESWMRLVADHHMPILLNGVNGPMSSSSGPMKTLGGTYPPDYGVLSVDSDEDSVLGAGEPQ